MANRPIDAHGCLLYFEADEPVVINTWTLINGLMETVMGASTDQPAQEKPVHNLDVMVYHFSSIERFPAIDISIEYDATDTSHQKLRTHAYSHTQFGLKFVGVQNTGSVDTFVVSGAITKWEQPNPVDDSRTAKATFQPSGPYYIDGTLHQ